MRWSSALGNIVRVNGMISSVQFFIPIVQDSAQPIRGAPGFYAFALPTGRKICVSQAYRATPKRFATITQNIAFLCVEVMEDDAI